MKHLFLLLFSIIATICQAQTYRTVDNKPGSTAQYTSLPQAISQAQDGDVILLSGSPISYGYVNLNKRLSILGPGYFLGQNPAPNTQALENEAIVKLVLSAGSSGSIINGISIDASDTTTNTNFYWSNSSNVWVSNCRIFGEENYYGQFLVSGVSATFTHCYWEDMFLTFLFSNTGSKISIQNSVLLPSATSGNPYFVSGYQLGNKDIDRYLGSSSLEIKNCTLVADYSFPLQLVPNVTGIGNNWGNMNAVYENNIFYNTGGFAMGTSSSASSTKVYMPKATYNIINTAGVFTGSTNQVIANLNTMFVGYPTNTSNFSPDGRFALATGSSAIGTAPGGKNIGAFQTTGGYNLSGIGITPNIYEISIPVTANTTDGININLKAQANDQ